MTWTPHSVFGTRAPAEALSARAGFAILDESGIPFEVHLDVIALFADVLFADCFESGDSTWWGVAAP